MFMLSFLEIPKEVCKRLDFYRSKHVRVRVHCGSQRSKLGEFRADACSRLLLDPSPWLGQDSGPPFVPWLCPLPHRPFYPGVHEDLPHLFVRCPRLAGLWARAAGGMLLGPNSDVSSLLNGLVTHLPPMCHPSYAQ
jgi:hypothetical protein